MRSKNGLTSTKSNRLAAAIDRIFPHRELVLRTEGKVSYFRFTPKFQIGLTGAVVIVAAWGLFTSVSFSLHDKVLQGKDNEIAAANLAYNSLLNEIAAYQRRFNTVTDELERNYALMVGVMEKNAALQQNLSSISQQLQDTESERQEVIDARERLRAQLSELETKMDDITNRNFSLKDNLNSTESNLQSVMAERNKALFDGARMKRRIDDLETRLSSLQESEGIAIDRLNERTKEQIASLRQVVEIAGLDVQQLTGVPESAPDGEGGPFIPVKPDDLPAGGMRTGLANLDLHLDRLEALQDAMKRMPLAAPLTTYYITSSFGKRRDPFTKRWAAHYGVDLGARMKSPIYSTAPGKVTFAGWKGRYGRLVEIDHGGGLKTRFGHLNKILVKKGATVKFRDKIALLGNSGRSTGPHLHYEILFNEKPLNPMKFIKAGRYVFKDN